ncbi:hypothetical protein M0R04_11875 [Candidatus Dojkabacteria bacterium]|jgi:hypothetical protein|nr:hypothetical protein [Candidatus Dojkabacteria bacterium]
MKKILFSLIFVFGLVTFAHAVNSNVYQLHTWSPSTPRTATEVTFVGESRDLTIINGDTSNGVWVDLKGVNTTCTANTAGCAFLPASGEISLYGFITDGINLITYKTQASPITVICVN